MRKKQKLEEDKDRDIERTGDDESKDSKFNELMETANRLFELKYVDVYEDPKETIEYEVNQDEIKKQREETQKKLKENGW